MERISHLRECSWSNNGKSSEASDGEGHGTTTFNHVPAENTVDKARRGPIPEFTLEELEGDRELWKHCLVGHLLDDRVFSTSYIQNWVNRVWGIGSSAQVVARDGNKYAIIFSNGLAQQFQQQEDPWLVDGAMFVMQEWKPNTKLRNMKVESIPLWMQILDLPLEYLNLVVARRFGNIAGRFERLDWEGSVITNTTTNIRFIRVRVWVNPHKPLLPGSFYKRDDGVRDWAVFSYERIHRFCKKCGRLGHTQTHCTRLNAEIEKEIDEQMESIRRELGYEIGNSMQVTNETNIVPSALAEQTEEQQPLGLPVMDTIMATTTEEDVAALIPANEEGFQAEHLPEKQGDIRAPNDSVFEMLENESLGVQLYLEPTVELNQVTPDNSPRAPPNSSVGQQATNFTAAYDKQQRRMERLFAEMSDKGDKLLDELLNRLYHDPNVQSADNKPRWIQTEEGIALFTNGRLTEKKKERQT
ncbi:hypothetical protein COLO4_35439 [Corchorus olitorius]|uniref:CCHC-type domain-containing protein n=1 Tax=Corchorus olitorius TaxID=93759 RepID=A0A1R3GGW1_9ROSI|nr:hypothetical protein COLO4_35439 [Corchorus olitorius]